MALFASVVESAAVIVCSAPASLVSSDRAQMADVAELNSELRTAGRSSCDQAEKCGDSDGGGGGENEDEEDPGTADERNLFRSARAARGTREGKMPGHGI